MADNQRPPHHDDARLEAVRRFSERAKACAQWRRSGSRPDALRSVAIRTGGAEITRVGPGKRGDSRSSA